MDPEFPNRPPGALNPDDMLARVHKRGARLRRRRQMGVTGLTLAAAGTAAAVVWAVIPAPTPHRIVSTAETPSSTALPSPNSCPVSTFTMHPAAAGSLPATSDFTSGNYRRLDIGQTVTVFADRALPGKSITLTRGVDTNSFAVSVWSAGPKPLVPVTVLGTNSDLYPAGDGTPGARIPFRFPEAGSQTDPCQRYQLQGVGVDDAALIKVAQSLKTTTAPPTTTAPTSTTPANPSLDSGVFSQPLAGPATVTVTADGLYVAVARQASSGTTTSSLERVDPTTGRVEATASLDGPFVQALETNGSLWVTTSSSSGLTLIRFDPTTLQTTGQWSLGRTPQQTGAGSMAVAGGGLWVAAGDRLLRVSPGNGSVTLSVPLPGAVGSDVAADAAGTILVDGRLNPGGGAVERRDPVTGALLASQPMTGVTPPLVTHVVGSSVWVSEPTGTRGYVERFDAASLQPASVGTRDCTEGYSTPTCVTGSNGITATTANGLVWITQSTGGSSLNYCADPTTGKVLASLPLPQPNEDTVVAIGPDDFYFTSYSAGANHLGYEPIPQACRASAT